jgi:hypothetical protein
MQFLQKFEFIPKTAAGLLINHEGQLKLGVLEPICVSLNSEESVTERTEA